MRFTDYSFGSVRVDGVTYDHDLIIDRGKIRKRKKAASRKFRGACGHPPLSIAEGIPWRCCRLVIGTGADGALPVMQHVRDEARGRTVDFVVLPTAQAIGVLGGTLPETVIGTYQTEREPHARSLIRLAKLVGTAMTSGGELGNLLRRAVAPRLHLVPGLKEQILTSPRPRPCIGPAWWSGRGCAAPSRAGRAPIRSWTTAAVSTTWSGRFAVITSAGATPAQRVEVEQRGGVLLAVRPGTELHRWLYRGRANAAIVRLDGTVLHACRRLSSLCA